MHRILLSNDDGIDAAGLQVLREAVAGLGEIWVAAPDRERSAVSHSISLHSPLRVQQVAERTYAVDGTPTDAVYLALNHLMPQPPDLLIAGINRGANLGNDVLYSGTVSAAMEGALFGHRAIAISQCIPGDFPKTQGSDSVGYSGAAELIVPLARSVLAANIPPGVVFNVNVPHRPRRDIAGIKLCRLGFTDWADSVSARTDPRGRPYYWIGGERNGHDDISDSDTNGINAGFMTLTPIHYDLTDYRSFKLARSLQIDGVDFVADDLGNDPLQRPVHPRSDP